jgi:hypothetical protein
MSRTSKDFRAFRKLTDRLLTVSRGELQKRLDAHKEKAAQNPNRRGPKPKIRPPSDSSDPVLD